MPTIEFLDAGKKVESGQYANLRKVALLNGVEIYRGVDRFTNCRGNGLCGTCVMEIVDGLKNLSSKNRRERMNLRLRGKPESHRLSCQCQVMGDVVCITAVALDNQPAAAKP